MVDQLPLTLPTRPALGRDAYIISDANAVALASVDDWRHWPQGKLVLVGPAGAGKTHLAQVWAQDASAGILAATDLEGQPIDALATGARVIEDIDRIAGQPDAERALFHLHNLMLAEGHALLMTSAHAPGRLSLVLPDLQSRLQATAVAQIEALDDALLGALLGKLFADRQIQTKPGLVDYVIPRIERSFSAAHEFVARMDRQSLAEKRNAGKKLAREVLAAMAERSMDNPPVDDA